MLRHGATPPELSPGTVDRVVARCLAPGLGVHWTSGGGQRDPAPEVPQVGVGLGHLQEGVEECSGYQTWNIELE